MFFVDVITDIYIPFQKSIWQNQQVTYTEQVTVNDQWWKHKKTTHTMTTWPGQLPGKTTPELYTPTTLSLSLNEFVFITTIPLFVQQFWVDPWSEDGWNASVLLLLYYNLGQCSYPIINNRLPSVLWECSEDSLWLW